VTQRLAPENSAVYPPVTPALVIENPAFVQLLPLEDIKKFPRPIVAPYRTKEFTVTVAPHEAKIPDPEAPAILEYG